MKLLSHTLVLVLVGFTAASSYVTSSSSKGKPPCTTKSVKLSSSKSAVPSYSQPGYSAKLSEGYPSGTKHGYFSEPAEGYPSETIDGYPSETTDRYPTETTDGYHSETIDGYPSQSADVYASESTHGYPSKPADVYPADTTYGSSSTPIHPIPGTPYPTASTPVVSESSSIKSASNTTMTSSTPSSYSSTTTPSSSPTSIKDYVVVSPTACLIAPKPSGAIISQSDADFSEANDGLTWEQYPDSRFKVQANDTSPPQYLDISVPSQISISDEEGNTLILYGNGTYAAYTALCELAVFGEWDSDALPDVTRRGDTAVALFRKRQAGSSLCKDIQGYCSSTPGQILNAVLGNTICILLGQRIGQTVGGAIGFLGNALGPEVGIPTTLGGVVIGGRIGAFLATKFGSNLCAAATTYAMVKICAQCPDPKLCGEGTLRCSLEGECQDVLSDPNNCGACGNTCPSGRCRNGQCTQPTCNQSVCGSLNTCTDSCYCFTAAGGTGFCGPSTPCAGLADCSSDFDCAQGMVCAVGTCCGRNVCHPPCTMLTKRDFPTGDNATEMYSNGFGGMTNLLGSGL
ncbi:hypothetical protein BDW02DRAFT_574783 [Decorospora gaudefroyi]|uniref:Uncharacterized protein n=1 Tax=Decorospora gaudefroyi TaxID=184978 RepID=A0A6A5JY57_9PLEO|nr:hypothetical protein BDW02DRAFT_574783 [Decorospora gaudefroyi]